MKTRKIGNLDVSAIGMGCMCFSHGYGQIPERSYSIEAIREAYNAGCTFFDTAEAYGNVLYYEGHNEEIVGEAVEPFRNEAVIATKFHIHDEELADSFNLYELIKGHLTKSLRRLRTDYVDLYYLHRVNQKIPLEEVAEGMGKLIEEGLIRGWGLSQVPVRIIENAHEITPLSAVQNIYSMVERGVEAEVIPYCLENNIGLVPFSPIASGFLSGKVKANTDFSHSDDVRKFVPQLKKENIEANRPIIDLLEEYAEKKNSTNAQISLAWMLHKYPNVVPIPGSKNQERILENLGAWNVELSKSEFSALEDALNKIEVHGYRGFNETEGGSMEDWGKKK